MSLTKVSYSMIDSAPVSVKDFGAVGDGVTDDTAAIQAAINVCQSNTQYGAKAVYLPAGRYKTTSDLVVSNQFITIFGDGPWASQINFNGSNVNGIKPSAITYLRPMFHDFALVGNSATGKAIDFSSITGQVYLGELKNLYLESGSDGLYAPLFFSMVVQNVSSLSYNGHSFRVACGPGVSWISCYAVQAGVGKAGYRLNGIVNMFACNGVNLADYWGVFGNDLASADGFQSDFATDDYPDINLYGCNIEYFGSLTTDGEGIRVQNNYRSFNVIGGKIDRFELSTNYSALIHCRKSSNGGTEPVKMSFGSVFLGSGTPSKAYLYSDTGARFFDQSDSLYQVGVTSFKQASVVYPLMRQWVAGDIYGDGAHYFSAISPRRLSVQMVRYALPDALTPVGLNQVIDVTGYTKVTVTPAAPASIYKAVFNSTPNTVSDYGRNGDLIIEAGNANLTIVHLALGTGNQTFYLAGGANLTLLAGRVVRFCYSSTANQWIQV